MNLKPNKRKDYAALASTFVDDYSRLTLLYHFYMFAFWRFDEKRILLFPFSKRKSIKSWQICESKESDAMPIQAMLYSRMDWFGKISAFTLGLIYPMEIQPRQSYWQLNLLISLGIYCWSVMLVPFAKFMFLIGNDFFTKLEVKWAF